MSWGMGPSNGTEKWRSVLEPPTLILLIFTFYGHITNSQSDQLPVGLIAQLAEHCSCIQWVRIPSKPEFFQALFSQLQCLSWVHNCNDLPFAKTTLKIMCTSISPLSAFRSSLADSFKNLPSSLTQALAFAWMVVASGSRLRRTKSTSFDNTWFPTWEISHFTLVFSVCHAPLIHFDFKFKKN